MAAIPGHNIPMAMIGTLILAFGWFGFNAGSTLAASDPRIGLIAANTMIASAGGALSALFYLWFRFHKPTWRWRATDCSADWSRSPRLAHS